QFSQPDAMDYCDIFFARRRRHTRSKRDWSSDVCSSDLTIGETDLDGVIALPGAGEALAAVRGQRWAAVTSGEARIMIPRLEAAGLTPPEVMITADDVTRGKPDPEGYAMAARRLGVDPQRCLVVEDAPAGIAAGLAAGAHVLAVTTTHETDEL